MEDRLGLLKNKPSLTTFQMQIDGQKVLASFYEFSKQKLGIKGFFDIYFVALIRGSARFIEKISLG